MHFACCNNLKYFSPHLFYVDIPDMQWDCREWAESANKKFAFYFTNSSKKMKKKGFCWLFVACENHIFPSTTIIDMSSWIHHDFFLTFSTFFCFKIPFDHMNFYSFMCFFHSHRPSSFQFQFYYITKKIKM